MRERVEENQNFRSPHPFVFEAEVVDFELGCCDRDRAVELARQYAKSRIENGQTCWCQIIEELDRGNYDLAADFLREHCVFGDNHVTGAFQNLLDALDD